MRRGDIRAVGGAVAAVIAVALGGCADGSSSATEVTPTRTVEPTVEDSPSPVAVETPSVSAAPVEVPEVDLTISSDADVERVVRQIIDFRDWLYANPERSALISSIYWPVCPCTDVLRERMRDLEVDAVRIETTAPNEIVSVNVRGREDGAYTLGVTYRQGPARVLTEDGEVLETQEGYGDEIREGWVVVSDAAGTYRLMGVDRQ